MSKFTELVQRNISDINQVSLYGATSIGNFAFRDCSSLTSIIIPSGVESIRSSAFRDCSSLTTITIPDTVTSIDRLAFAGTTTSVSKRLRINFLGQNPATIYSYGLMQGGTFTITSTSSSSIYADVHIPVGSEATYRANSDWNTFFNSSNVTVTADL